MIYYNGFNLLVDILLAFIVGFLVYRATYADAWLDGYGKGEADASQSEHYYTDWHREQE